MVLNLELAKPLIRVGSSTCSYEDSKVPFDPLARLLALWGVFLFHFPSYQWVFFVWLCFSCVFIYI